MADDIDQGALTESESTELTSLRSEMADPSGKQYDGDWSSHYTHNETKQTRARELLAREAGEPVEAADRADDPAPVEGQEADAEELVQVEGFETPAVADVQAMVPGMDTEQATESIDRAMMILQEVPEADRELFDTSLAGLPVSARVAIVAGLSLPPPESAADASKAVLQTLEAKGCGPLLQEWGIGASRRVGIANARVNAVIDGIESDQDAQEFTTWFNNLSGGELSAILRMVA